MKPTRRLALRRETLSELGSEDLRSVVGGTHIRTDCNCVTHGYSCDDCPIPTLPLNQCPNDVITPLIADTIVCIAPTR